MKVFSNSNIAKSFMLISIIVTILFAYDVSSADTKRTKGQTVYLSTYPKIEGTERKTPRGQLDGNL